MDEYGVIIFHTTSAAFRAEKVLQKAGLECRLIPTPREFSSDCGLAARFEWRSIPEVRHALNAAKVEVAGIHQLDIDSS